MHLRLKKIRTENRLTQEEFGRKIGIGKTSVSKLESGENNPSERTIKLICSEFNINEHWLRTGKGSPTKELSPTEEVEVLVRKIIDYNDQDEKNPFYDIIIDMMKIYHELDMDSQVVIQNYFNKLRLAANSSESNAVKSEIDRKVSEYRQELELEARQDIKLSVYEDITDANKKQA